MTNSGGTGGPARRGRGITAGAIGAAMVLALGFVANVLGLVSFVSGRTAPDFLNGASPSPTAPTIARPGTTGATTTPPAKPVVAPTHGAQPPPATVLPVRTVASRLSVSVNPSFILNRGVGMDLVITVRGATRGGYVDIDLFYPDTAPEHGGVCSDLRPGNDRCSAYRSDGGVADNWGEITFTFPWSPNYAYWLDASDAEGAWPIAIQDRASGRFASTELQVDNDADTPPPDTWT